jgi:formylglycine-generating enzyme required for sulfatase activity
VYPWGAAPPSGSASAPCDRAQWHRCAGDDGAPTRRVGSFAPTGGLYDLAGNVAEFNVDRVMNYDDARCWGDLPRADPLCGTRNQPGSDGRTTRGGSWDASDAGFLQTAALYVLDETSADATVGFRCVRTLP